MNTPKRGKQPLPIDKYIKDLQEESKKYLTFKNSASHSIKRLEYALVRMNTNVSFSCFLEENVSDNKTLKWYLEWEADNKSKDYGLNIVCEEVGDKNKILNISRQSFLTSDIELKAKYSKYLVYFIEEYKKNLEYLMLHKQNDDR